MVGGRDRGGRLLVQTRRPGHEVVEWVLHADPTGVMRAEAARRRQLAYPPFGAVAEVSGESDAVHATLTPLAASDAVQVLGPTTHGTGIGALVFAPDPDTLADVLGPAARAGRAAGRLRVAVDPPRV